MILTSIIENNHKKKFEFKSKEIVKNIIKKLSNNSPELKISKIARQVRQQHLTYLSEQKIYNLETCLKEIERKSIPGIFMEAGIALGGSGIIIGTLMADNRTFQGYDVFEMIPPPTEADDDKSKSRYEVIKNGSSKGIKGDRYYGYMNNLYEEVVNNFKTFGLEVDGKRICLFKGYFQDNMNFKNGDKIAFAHIDCDWYEPVKFCLETVYQALSSEGYIVIDDYHDYGGCKKAVHEFLATRNDLTIVAAKGNLVLRREPTQ